MKLVDLTKLTPQVGNYLTGKADALKSSALLQDAKQRRRNIARIMSAYDIETAKLRMPPGEFHISKKIDGEFTCLVYDNGACFSLNPYGTVRTGAPFHDEAAKLIKAAGIEKATFGGELYVRRPDGERSRVHDVVSIARAPKTKKELDQLNFAFFDIYELDDEDHSLDYAATYKRLTELFSKGKLVAPVETVIDEDFDGAFKYFKKWVLEEGGEGIVCRSDNAGTYKIKPRHSLDLAVVGFSEGVEDRAGMLHSLLLALPKADGSYQIIGRVGGGFSDRERVSFLHMLMEKVVESDYVEVNSHKVAYHMIAPELVAEISCLDIISKTSNGGPIERMALEWNGDENRWNSVRRVAFASIISPQFERFRDDKKANAEDVRLAQLTDIVEIPDVNKSVEELSLPESTLMKRVVGVKESRGAKMVRKLVMWKTNKEDISDEYPAYVLHLTDFSPNRKDPLKHDIRVTNSKEQIEEMFEAWQVKNFVKGWEVVIES